MQGIAQFCLRVEAEFVCDVEKGPPNQAAGHAADEITQFTGDLHEVMGGIGLPKKTDIVAVQAFGEIGGHLPGAAARGGGIRTIHENRLPLHGQRGGDLSHRSRHRHRCRPRGHSCFQCGRGCNRHLDERRQENRCRDRRGRARQVLPEGGQRRRETGRRSTAGHRDKKQGLRPQRAAAQHGQHLNAGTGEKAQLLKTRAGAGCQAAGQFRQAPGTGIAPVEQTHGDGLRIDPEQRTCSIIGENDLRRHSGDHQQRRARFEERTKRRLGKDGVDHPEQTGIAREGRHGPLALWSQRTATHELEHTCPGWPHRMTCPPGQEIRLKRLLQFRFGFPTARCLYS